MWQDLPQILPDLTLIRLYQCTGDWICVDNSHLKVLFSQIVPYGCTDRCCHHSETVLWKAFLPEKISRCEEGKKCKRRCSFQLQSDILAIFLFLHICGSPNTKRNLPASVDARPTGCRFDLRQVRNIFSWRFDHEIFSTVILSLPLNQEGHLSVSGERMCTILVNFLED